MLSQFRKIFIIPEMQHINHENDVNSWPGAPSINSEIAQKWSAQ